MDSNLKLGLDFLLRGKIVCLEGAGHPRILEALVGHWKSRTMQEIEVSREGVTRKIVAAGTGTIYELSMFDLISKGTFSDAKHEMLGDAGHATLLAVSHLGFEVPQSYRTETVRMLILARIEKLRKCTDTPLRPCAIFGVDGEPGTLANRYGQDLRRLVGEVGVFIETP